MIITGQKETCSSLLISHKEMQRTEKCASASLHPLISPPWLLIKQHRTVPMSPYIVRCPCLRKHISIEQTLKQCLANANGNRSLGILYGVQKDDLCRHMHPTCLVTTEAHPCQRQMEHLPRCEARLCRTTFGNRHELPQESVQYPSRETYS